MADFLHSARLAFIEARPSVQAIFALRFLLGALLSGTAGRISIAQGLEGQFSWFTATWFVYLLNGVSDRIGDHINGSSRPLASGRLSTLSALRWCRGLAVFSLIAAAFAGWAILIGSASLLLLGWLYSVGPFPLKRSSVSSSLTVGIAGLLTYVCGALSYRHAVSESLLVFAVVMSLWMLVAGNSKDFGDEAGDAISGRKSLSILLGPRRAGVVVSGLCLTVGAVGAYLALANASLTPLALLLPTALVMTSVWFRREGKSARNKTPYRVFMVSQYGVNLSALAISAAAP